MYPTQQAASGSYATPSALPGYTEATNPTFVDPAYAEVGPGSKKLRDERSYDIAAAREDYLDVSGHTYAQIGEQVYDKASEAAYMEPEAVYAKVTRPTATESAYDRGTLLNPLYTVSHLKLAALLNQLIAP